MRVPFNWLKEFTPLSVAAEELGELLTMRGLEVEGIERHEPAFADVYVGTIVDMSRHPSADKLSICSVDTGKEILPIVCGAPNVAKGLKVPVAVPGARLADGSAIAKRELRGVESSGMLCSEKELGLSDDHSGIFILPDDTATGVSLATILEIEDSVLDVNVPPNRGDLQSILGIAREAAAVCNLPLTLPPFTLAETEDLGDLVDLVVHDRQACPRYVLRLIKDISIVPAPFWMRSRITKCGMRPINSIVDVTNYVMLELGQPLHAFDYEKIGARRIEVKSAGEKLVFRTLDGIDRKIEAADVLICDGKGPVALAGVMGGENSEIGPSTRHVALESAFFDPLSIRRTARRLDLRSEASSRFEKGIDMEAVDYCSRRAMELMFRTSGGRVFRGSKEVYEKPPQRLIPLSLKRAEEIVGTRLDRGAILEALDSIGIHQAKSEADQAVFAIPSFRHDVTEYCDLIEEVARIVGYDNIPATVPVSSLLPVTRQKKDADIDSAKAYLTACGFFEMINYAFFDTKDIDNFSIEPTDERLKVLPIINPISKDLGVMRTFLTPGILENLAYNVNRGIRNARVFEIGKVFFNETEGDLPREVVHLAAASCGKEREYFWRDPFKGLDFFDLKGVLEGLFDSFNLAFEVRPTSEPFLDRGASADLFINGGKIAWIGEVNPSVLSQYDIKEKVFCAEADFDRISDLSTEERTYRPISRYPSVVRDFSFYVDDSIPTARIIETIRGVSPLVASVGVFDLFKKEVRSVSFRVVFQSYEDTLTDEAVNELQQIIIDRLKSTDGIKLRT
jgi:phenylalanyl-tRNA synthetase beta chain